MDYSREFGSQFPSSLINVGTKKDIDDSVKDLINQYNAYCDAGDLSSAFNIYEQNKNILKNYMIDMKYINQLEEEIYNTGLFALNQTSVIYSDIEPETQSENGRWIMEY